VSHHRTRGRPLLRPESAVAHFAFITSYGHVPLMHDGDTVPLIVAEPIANAVVDLLAV